MSSRVESLEIRKVCRELRSSINDIVLVWIERVQADPYLRADDDLTHIQIVDHIPQMLEELCDLLEHGSATDFKDIRASSHHGYRRALEGYTLTELLREIELLRDCVFTFVAETEAGHNLTRTDIIAALRTVNEYFGEDVIFIVEHYLRRSEPDASIA
ncbi:MAG: RsbRD N-terminal domain-containing protein [Pyrinomonadaceae bacterium MAG19_C2-C3]|nr:RsbRD N-terminal domain-containing protein [Pyrinomonadaceae bacterium MAG19_C2-C3]